MLIHVFVVGLFFDQLAPFVFINLYFTYLFFACVLSDSGLSVRLSNVEKLSIKFYRIENFLYRYLTGASYAIIQS